MGAKQRAKAKAHAAKDNTDGEQPSEPIPYTQEERSRKWTNITFELGNMRIFDDIMTPYVRIGMRLFVDVGRDFVYKLELPQYSRTAHFNFVNDKRKEKENGLKIVFNKIRVDGEGDENKVNELNKLQENLF